MLEIVLDVLSWCLVVVGCAFTLIGGIGLLRMPDLFTRMHAASVSDTMGMAAILMGLMLQAINGVYWISLVKLAVILAFVLYTGPLTAHALAQAALRNGVKPEGAEDLSDHVTEGGQ